MKCLRQENLARLLSGFRENTNIHIHYYTLGQTMLVGITSYINSTYYKLWSLYVHFTPGVYGIVYV